MRALLLMGLAFLLAGVASAQARPRATVQKAVLRHAQFEGACAEAGRVVLLRGQRLTIQGSGVTVVARSWPGTPELQVESWSANQIQVRLPNVVEAPRITAALRSQSGAWRSNNLSFRTCGASASRPSPDPSIDPLTGARKPRDPRDSRPRRRKDVLRPLGESSAAPPVPRTAPKAQGVKLRERGAEIVILFRAGADDQDAPGQLRERFVLSGLGLILHVRWLSGTEPVAQILRDWRHRPGVISVDVNHRLELLASSPSPKEYPARLVGWKKSRENCGQGLRLGLVDSGVDRDLPIFGSSGIRERSFGDGESSREHGTAIASLLVGSDAGLLPKADLWVASAVSRAAGGNEEASISAVVRALDWLLSEGVQAVNLSLGGSRNRVLEEVIGQVVGKGMILVAAAGNGGPAAPPMYPAAYNAVVAVSAVDARQKPWSRSHRGGYVDLVAPGVDVWVARSGSDGAYVSGTSFAAPFVTAAIALQGRRSPDSLFDAAIDLGPPGHDPTYGHGLLRAPAECAETSGQVRP